MLPVRPPLLLSSPITLPPSGVVQIPITPNRHLAFEEDYLLLLAYLPRNKALWSSELAKKRSQNKNFKDDLLRNPLLYDTFHEVKKKNDRRKYTSSDEFEEYGRGRSNQWRGPRNGERGNFYQSKVYNDAGGGRNVKSRKE
ncbi:hypothetical protein Tco_1018476 [Tanacetum coccineum]|uniref:Uncharacterized protein n=1 Tax=Tanacetum coccineum TaxID=301880 RepID=A0ABQ5FUE2_9ASTR